MGWVFFAGWVSVLPGEKEFFGGWGLSLAQQFFPGSTIRVKGKKPVHMNLMHYLLCNRVRKKMMMLELNITRVGEGSSHRAEP